MKNLKHYCTVSLVLILLSVVMFYFHYLLFGDFKNTLYYSLMNLCFIPMNILAVTLVFEKIMERRAKLERLSKLNMLVGVFFSDIGYQLLDLIVASDYKATQLHLDFSDLKSVKKTFNTHTYTINLNKLDYSSFENLIMESRDILTQLISNENILEHEYFADLLMAVMHLRDEFVFIKNKTLTHTDQTHLIIDITKVYKALIYQWIDYLNHLKTAYPYLYSGAIKVAPFHKANT